MKKKITYIGMFILTFIISINTVNAAGFTSNVRYNVCGINNVPENVPMLTSGIYNLIKIAVPIILIIMAIVDLLGAVSASDTDKMKKSQKKLVTRLIAAIFIFFIMAIVQFVFKKVDNGETGFSNCMNCILSNNCDGATTVKTYKACNIRGINDCTSEGDSDAYGHKCMLEGTKCIADCSSYNTNSCPTSYCTFTATDSSGQYGICKKKNKVKIVTPPSVKSNDKNESTGGTSSDNLSNGSTSSNASSYSNTNCKDCSGILDPTGRSICEKNCIKETTTNNTSNSVTTQNNASKCSSLKNSNACINAGGCSWVNNTCVSSGSSTSTINKCTSIKNSNACINAGGCSWINGTCVPK